MVWCRLERTAEAAHGNTQAARACGAANSAAARRCAADSFRRRPAGCQQRCLAPFQTVRSPCPKALIEFLRLCSARRSAALMRTRCLRSRRCSRRCTSSTRRTTHPSCSAVPACSQSPLQHCGERRGAAATRGAQARATGRRARTAPAVLGAAHGQRRRTSLPAACGRCHSGRCAVQRPVRAYCEYTFGPQNS